MFEDQPDSGCDLDGTVLKLANRGFAVDLSDVDVAHAIINWIEEETGACKPDLVVGVKLLAPLVAMSSNAAGKTLGGSGVRRLRQALLQLPFLPELTLGMNSFVAHFGDNIGAKQETRELLQRPRPPHDPEFGQVVTMEIQSELKRLRASRDVVDDRGTPRWFEGLSNPQPPLYLRLVKSTDASRFFYGSESRPMLGREEELAALDGFLWSQRPFAWWLVTGPRGQGKSRLALELCLRNAMTWRVGFLPPAVDFDWHNWKPERPTLLAVEYYSWRADELRAIASALHQSCTVSEFPVRLLLVERDWPSSLGRSPKAWATDCASKFLGDGEDRVDLETAAYQDLPLVLGSLGDEHLWSILEGELSTAIANPPDREEALSEFRRIDSHGRPLYALLLADSVASGSWVSDVTSLVRGAINRLEARWQPLTSPDREWQQAQTDRHRHLLALATMTGGLNIEDLPFAETEDYLPVPGSHDRERAFDKSRYEVMSGIPDARSLLPLQPDLIGELFVLDCLNPSDEDDELCGNILLEASWRISPLGMFSFLTRVVREFPDHPAFARVYRPASRTAEQRMRWAAAVGVATYYLGQARKPVQARALHDDLTTLVERHPDEPVLRQVWAAGLLVLSECYQRSPCVSLDSAASLYSGAAPLIEKYHNERTVRENATSFLVNMIAFSLRQNDVERARNYHARLLELVENETGESDLLRPLILGTCNLCASLANGDQFTEAVTIFDGLRARLVRYPGGEQEHESFAAAAAELGRTFVQAGRLSDAHAFLRDLTSLVRQYPNEARLWEHYRSAASVFSMAFCSGSDWSAARALYDDLSAFTKEHPEDDALSCLTFDVGHALIHFFSRTGYLVECQQIYEEQQNLLDVLPPDPRLLGKHAMSTVTLIGAHGTTDLDAACKLFDHLGSITRTWQAQSAAPRHYGHGLFNMLTAYGHHGKLSDALILYDELAELALECDDDELCQLQTRAAWNLNLQCLEAGLEEEARRVRASIEENQRLRVLAKWDLESSGRVTPKRCSRCGLESAHLKPPGTLFLISHERLDQLRLFFFGLYDYPQCEACNNRLSETAGIVVLSSSGEAFYSRGSMPGHTTSQVREMLREREQRDYEVVEVPSHDDLRRTILRHFQPRLALLLELLNSLVAIEPFLKKHWRELDADFFRFSEFILSLPQVSLGPGWDNVDVLEPLAMTQAGTWVLLVDRWSYKNSDRGESLDQDVGKYIKSGCVLANAVDKWSDLFRNMTVETPDPSRESYVLHAVNSILCAAAATANDFSKRWVELFFDFETDAVLRPDQIPTDLVLSSATVQGSLTASDCWDVYKDRIPIGPAGLMESGKQLSSTLRRICEKAGYPQLPKRFLTNLTVGRWEAMSDRQLLDLAKDQVRKFISDYSEWTFDALQLHTREFMARDAPAPLEELADMITELRGGTAESRISSEVWLGGVLREMRQPARFLDRIGRQPQAWELELPPGGARIHLWIERSNALRMLGDTREALAVIEEVASEMSEDLSDDNRQVILRNRAILLRENGDPEAALEELNKLRGLATGGALIGLLDSIFMCQERLGEYEAARDTLGEALDHLSAYPDLSMWRKLKAAQAALLANSGEHYEAARILIELGGELDAASLPPAASAWAALVHGDQVPEDGRDILTAIYERVAHEAERSIVSRDVQGSDALLKVAALLARALHQENADALMTKSYEFSHQNNLPTDIFVLAYLASRSYERGDLDKARSISHELPNSLAEEVGQAGHLPSVVAKYGRRVGNEFATLAKAAKDSEESNEGLRFIGELQRDTVGRFRRFAQSGSEGEFAILQDGLSDASVAGLSFWKGDVAILEWLEVGGFLEGRLTTISSTGDVEARTLLIDADVLGLCQRVRTRIRNWWPGRAGDPFALEEWAQLEEQMREAINDAAPSRAQVVVLEHQDLTGMPWHVALREWPVSYASSWSSLLHWEQTRPPSTTAETMAMVTVPKVKESESVLTAMRASALRARDLCQNATIRIETSEGAALDRATVLRMMQTADVSKLLCHGFVSYAEREVALMVANEEQLPLLSAASRSPRGKQHRLFWHHLAEAEALSPLVFSGACGSGAAHIFGAGDKLGLFEGLRLGGTRSFVAPRWDIVARSGLPVLDDAMQNWISGNMNIAEAVHAACKSAEGHVPLWQAWSLAVDGDWKWRNHSRAI